MQILIIQTAFIGDVILTTPLVEAVKEAYTDGAIDFLTIPASRDIIGSNPKVRYTILFDKNGHDRGFSGLKKMAYRLSSTGYDICLTPHRSWRSAFLSRKTKAPVRVGFDCSASPGAFTHIQHYPRHAHEIERNLSLLHSLDLDADIRQPSIYPTDHDKQIVEQRLKTVGTESSGAYFALAPGSVWPTKRWPSAYFSYLAQRIEHMGYRVVLIGGPRDKALCEQIQRPGSSVISVAGDFSLRQTYYFLTKCGGLVTNDSAPLHLGLAAQIPLYCIFGATVPAFGFAPFGENSFIFENRNLACRPCGIHGGHKCPTKTFDCMLTVKPEDIEFQIMTTRDRNSDE